MLATEKLLVQADSCYATIKPGVHLKFTVPAGMPDVDSILAQEQLDTAIYVKPSLLIFIIINMLVNAYFSGGWLSLVFSAIKGENADPSGLWERSRYFCGRLLMARILTLLLGIVMVFSAFILGPLAVILPVALLILTFFWEQAIVCEDLLLGEGFTRGHEVLRANLGEVFMVALAIGLFSTLASLVANLIVQNMLGYLLVIPIWSFVGGVFSVAMCALYQRLAQPAVIPPTNELL